MRHLRFGIGFAISGAALYFALRGVEWRGVGDALGDANLGLLALAPPLLFLLFAMRAQRWRLLFYPDRGIRLYSTFSALNIGYMVGNLLPLQLGEVARAYVLGEVEGINKARVLSTIAVERLLDVLFLLALGIVLIPFVALPSLAMWSAGVFVLVLVAATSVVALAVIDRPRFERLLDRLLLRLPARMHGRGREVAVSMLDGLSALSHPRTLASVAAWTVICWLTSATILYVVLRAFALDVPVTAAPFLLVVTTFAFFVPSSPGAVGVYHAVTITTLTTVFSVAQGPATSYALVVHAILLIPPTLFGAGLFWSYHLNVRRMRSWRAAETPEDALVQNHGALPPLAIGNATDAV